MSNKNKKITESLLGFYMILVEIFAQSGIKFKDPVIAGLMIKAHLFELINYHKKKTIDDEIAVPKTTELYKGYISGWNKHIRKKEAELEQLVIKYKESKTFDYIS